jgi:hypothetical protein
MELLLELVQMWCIRIAARAKKENIPGVTLMAMTMVMTMIMMMMMMMMMTSKLDLPQDRREAGGTQLSALRSICGDTLKPCCRSEGPHRGAVPVPVPVPALEMETDHPGLQQLM